VSPPQAQALELAGPAGRLEALAEEPAGGERQGFALLCHPHPLHGGTLNNKVVHTLARAFQERGYATLRFNFRGVGLSEGRFDDARGEVEDALAAFAFARSRWPGGEQCVGGFSFGAFIAYRVALVRPVARLVTVAPPIARFNFTWTEVPASPWLVVQGGADEVVDAGEVRRFVAALHPAPTLAWLADASHFFHGRLAELKAAVQSTLPAAAAHHDA
jgi:alpha/beta superfamily hydrolase